MVLKSNAVKLVVTLVVLMLTTSLSYSSKGPAQMKTIPSYQSRGYVISDNVRFTVLTPAMIRLEWSNDGMFEDRPSFVIKNREFAPPDFKSTLDHGWLIIETEELVLNYRAGSGNFDGDNLSIRLKSEVTPVTWRPGMKDTSNLGGTVRTLDQASGSIPVGPGLISRDGWVVIDDSHSLVLDENGWPTPRQGERTDWYFLGYGHDYQRALSDFTEVSGKIPLPPRWLFGSWWSRYWNYTDQELKDIVAEFRRHDVPLDILVVDMDWHLPGWTGYTWNAEYFPDPEGFLDWCHKEGLHVTLNLHPHDGVRKHESAFPEFAREMGLDPDSVDHIPFDIADPHCMDAYFKVLHHPLQKQGVDFWWIDWQQGKSSKIPGLDPLHWLNHLHWMDMEKNPGPANRRPLIFSRWGGLGAHTYQIGFSGDTHSIWASLAFQPYFTSTAGNVLYPYWSHDIGGHFYGPVEDELFARWIQFGALSPVLRTHATKNPLAERRIWTFPDEIFESARKAFHLRYSLVPYFYTTARECYDTALPILRPLYYQWPELDEAYEFTDEYMLGERLLIAPVTAPRNKASGCAETRIWLPPGKWNHWFTGQTFHGPEEIFLMTPLDEIPIFVREGSIIPTMRKAQRIGNSPLEHLVLNCFPGDSGSFTMYEDDGDSRGYQDDEYALTGITMNNNGKHCQINIGKADGDYNGKPSHRTYEVRLRDVWPVKSVNLNGEKIDNISESENRDRTGWWYDSETFSTIITLPRYDVNEPLKVSFVLSDKDETLLRKGLRGQFGLINDLAGLCSKDIPDDVNYLNNIRHDLSKDSKAHTAADKLSEIFEEKWASLIDRFLEPGVIPSGSRQAFLRMLGIINDFSITPIDSDKIELTATVLVQEPVEDLKVKTEFISPAGWKQKEPYEDEFTALISGYPYTRKTVVKHDGEIGNTVLSARFTFQIPGGTVEFALNETILPSINSWYVVGPFDNPWENGLDITFKPEIEQNLAATYKGKNGLPIKWQDVALEIGPDTDLREEFYIDFNKVFGVTNTDAVAYALTYVLSPEETEAVLAVGSDDGIVVWLNGREIHRNATGRPYVSREDRVPINLRNGKNTLLLKINQGRGGWGFCAHIEGTDKNPIPGIRTGIGDNIIKSYR